VVYPSPPIIDMAEWGVTGDSRGYGMATPPLEYSGDRGTDHGYYPVMTHDQTGFSIERHCLQVPTCNTRLAANSLKEPHQSVIERKGQCE
jgi:hypothetical protein